MACLVTIFLMRSVSGKALLSFLLNTNKMLLLFVGFFGY